MGLDRYMELMSHDKKVQDGKLRLVLLESIGKAVISENAPIEEIRAAITKRCTEMRIGWTARFHIGALQHIELAGVYQYIWWLPLIFVQAEAQKMMLGFFHRWPIEIGRVIWRNA